MKIVYEPIPAFRELLEPYRYKVYYGGRGSAKSYNFALTLLILTMQKKLRVLCAREFQNSISDSVHRLLSDLIDRYKLPNFEVTQREIRNRLTGSEFIFKGLRHNIQSIKSTEGVDICWVEEAQTVSEESWRVLIPTIRKPNSEIWVSFNPFQVDDPTYQRFIINTPPDTLLKKVTYKDNPYFPESLQKEMEYDKRVDEEMYRHIWEGECLLISDRQVFKNKFEVGVLPTDDCNEVYFGCDFGFAKDPTTLIKCFIFDNFLYIAEEAYGVGVEIDDIPKLFSKVSGFDTHIIRADSSQPMTISYLARNGLNIVGVKKWQGSVMDGINFMKKFEKIVIHPDCKHTYEEFRFYSYKTNSAGDILPDVEDKHNHCIDAIRYALEPLIDDSTVKSLSLDFL